MNLDRFSQGLPDPQEAEVKAYCEGCGGEIYEGENAFCYDGEYYHSPECLAEHLLEIGVARKMEVW